MKKTKKKNLYGLLVVFMAALSFAACSDKIDDSDLYVLRAKALIPIVPRPRGFRSSLTCARVSV